MATNINARLILGAGLLGISTLAFAVVSGSLTYLLLPSYPNTYATTPLALNQSGTIVGYYQPVGGAVHGYKEDGLSFTTVEPPGSLGSSVEGINDHGDMVGVYCPTLKGCPGETGQYGFSYKNGTYHKLAYPLPKVATIANAINNLGQVVGGYCPGPVACAPGGGIQPSAHAFSLSRSVYTTVDFPGALGTEAQGVNDAGDIVGYYEELSGRVHGYLYSAGVFSTIDPPGATYTLARGINNAGTITGGFIDAGGHGHAFTFQYGAYTTVDVPHSTSSSGNGINNAGAFVLQAVVNVSGPASSFEATPTASSTADPSAEAAESQR